MRRLPDKEAKRHNQVRIIDESGEDYLYPETILCSYRSPDANKRQNLRKNSLTTELWRRLLVIYPSIMMKPLTVVTPHNTGPFFEKTLSL